jgi:hypothetical protein
MGLILIYVGPYANEGNDKGMVFPMNIMVVWLWGEYACIMVNWLRGEYAHIMVGWLWSEYACCSTFPSSSFYCKTENKKNSLLS